MRSPESRLNGQELLHAEMTDAEEEMIRRAQQEAFPKEYMALTVGKEFPKKILLSKLGSSQISGRFWIIAAREEIREWENECNEGNRRRAKTATQVMAPLPQVRLRFTCSRLLTRQLWIMLDCSLLCKSVVAAV